MLAFCRRASLVSVDDPPNRISVAMLFGSRTSLRTGCRPIPDLVDQPEMGRLRHAGIPVKHSRTPGKVRNHAPLLGEHNDYVLGELLGMAPEEIRRLEELEVVY